MVLKQTDHLSIHLHVLDSTTTNSADGTDGHKHASSLGILEGQNLALLHNGGNLLEKKVFLSLWIYVCGKTESISQRI